MSKPQNVILISIDTLRADHLSCYGYARQTTPNIDRLAMSGVRFSSANSTAVWTPPAHASMLTGVYPNRHGVLHQNKLSTDIPTIAEILQNHSFHTVGFVNNSQVGPMVGLDRGHEDFYQVWKGYAPKQVLHRLYRKTKQSFGYIDHGSAKTNSLVKQWLKTKWQRDKPFYMFIHYIDVHNPLRAPRPFCYRYLRPELRNRINMEKLWSIADNPLVCVSDNAKLSADEIEALTCLYDEEIAYVDKKIGELMKWLLGMDLLDDTLLIITADHGEHLGERQMFSHVASLYQPIVHIPLILRHPVSGKRGEVCDVPVQHIDILPTILEVCGLENEMPPSAPGQSLLQISEDSTIRREPLFAEWEGRIPHFVRNRLAQKENKSILKSITNKRWMCRKDNYKLILDSTDNCELYNLEKDPHEQHDLSEEKPKTLASLKQALVNYMESATDNRTESYDYSESAVKDHLKALGYL